MSDEERMEIVMLLGETETQACARAIMHPFSTGAVTAAKFRKGFAQDIELGGQVDELKRQLKQISEGDMSRGDEMMVAQAHTLDAVFNSLMCKASINMEAGHFGASQAYLSQAFKAQNQCRNVWESISRIKNPPLRQTNIAHNQQINNIENPQSKVLNGESHERLESATQGSASSINPTVETVDTIYRAKDG